MGRSRMRSCPRGHFATHPPPTLGIFGSPFLLSLTPGLHMPLSFGWCPGGDDLIAFGPRADTISYQ
jgi:hypothetical protein